jgi:hypothetical protein
MCGGCGSRRTLPSAVRAFLDDLDACLAYRLRMSEIELRQLQLLRAELAGERREATPRRADGKRTKIA